MSDVQADQWRKSSYSHVREDCVALNGRLDSVRDTKNGDVLRLSRFSVSALLTAARNGMLDR